MEFVSVEKNIITFKSGSKLYSRKLNEDKEFSFNKNKYFYHYSFSMGYGSTSKIYQITEKLKSTLDKYKNKGWTGVQNFLEDISYEYSNKQGETSYIPAGPDSSKFRATVSGFIRPLASPQTIGTSSYSCGSYFHRGLQIGGNAKTDQELFVLIRYILPKLSKPLGYTGSDSKVYYKESKGTNFSTYGIG